MKPEKKRKIGEMEFSTFNSAHAIPSRNKTYLCGSVLGNMGILIQLQCSHDTQFLLMNKRGGQNHEPKNTMHRYFLFHISFF